MKSNEQLRNDTARRLPETDLNYPTRLLKKAEANVINRKIAESATGAGKKPKITPLSAFSASTIEKKLVTEAPTADNHSETTISRVTPNIFSHLKKPPCRPQAPTPYAVPYRHVNKQFAVQPPAAEAKPLTANGDPAGYVPLPTVEEISAGGIVIDAGHRGHRVAIIARYNRARRIEWCLPKGHPEGDENLGEAAVREIEEETGITGNIVTALGNVDYWFSAENYRVHKTVHHFLLEKTGGDLTVENDPDQETVDVAWVKLEDLGQHLTFLNEKRIAEVAMHMLELY